MLTLKVSCYCGNNENEIKTEHFPESCCLETDPETPHLLRDVLHSLCVCAAKPSTVQKVCKLQALVLAAHCFFLCASATRCNILRAHLMEVGNSILLWVTT